MYSFIAHIYFYYLLQDPERLFIPSLKKTKNVLK